MSHIQPNYIKNILSEIIKLNPFDAVVIVKGMNNNYYVEMVNAQAAKLSHNITIENGKTFAKDFFHFYKWEQLKPLFNTKQNQVEFILQKDSKKLTAVLVQAIGIEDEAYFSVIIREDYKNTINEELDLYSTESNSFQLISYRDDLTGLLNRKALNEQWSNDISTFKDGRNVALLLVDVDRFKKYNESLGQNAADSLLKLLSKRLLHFSNEYCEIYRYNGDEFVIVLRYLKREEIENLANHILAIFKEPFLIEEQEYFLTSSIGISLSSYGLNDDLETVLHQAEQAVYYAKNNGRFHYRFFRSEMSQSFPNEVLMEAHLRRAIEFDELTINLQPQIDLYTDVIDSFEALIRWNNRKFGYVPPSQFIPLAESSGLIIQIGDWVLEQVCKHLQEWKLKGYRPVRIAVNISPKQFKEKNFALKIEHLLTKYQIEPKYLELEITESSMVNVDETHSILTKLKQLGVFVSVDDFGTGYSSLSYLKKYPIDIIKIDQSFIADINKDKRNEAIIKAIITLSHNLGMEVVAEGVEEKLQEQFLKQHNCRKGQGYLYNKPLPVDEIIEEYFVN